MDTAKLRVLAAVGGAIFGFAGLLGLMVAFTLLLVPAIGAIGATATTGALLLAAAAVCIYIFLEPNKSTADEIEAIEDVTADALADLPFDALQSIIEKRPITVAVVALLTGYTLLKPDANTSKSLQRILLGIL